MMKFIELVIIEVHVLIEYMYAFTNDQTILRRMSTCHSGKYRSG